MKELITKVISSYKKDIILKSEINEVLMFIEKAIGFKIDSLSGKNVFKIAIVERECKDLKLMLEYDKLDFIKNFFQLLQWYYVDFLNGEIPEDIEKQFHFLESGYKKMYYSDLIKLGYKPKEIIMDLIKIDKDTMPEMPEELAGSSDTWIAQLEANPYRVAVIVLRKRIIGYLTMDALTKMDYKKTLKGKLHEDKIKPIKLEPGRKYNFYLTSIAVFKKYRNFKILLHITDMFFDILRNYAQKKIIVENLVANAYSSEGEFMCKLFDMNYLKDHISDGKIYHIQLYPIDVEHNFIKKHKDIVRFYKDFEAEKKQKRLKNA